MISKMKVATPNGWQKLFDTVKKMRATNPNAPVDTIGCDMLHDTTASREVQRYQMLLALMLSSQTRDQKTAAAMEALKKYGCTVDNLLHTSEAKVKELIHPVSFYNRKAEYIKRTTLLITREHNRKVPTTYKELLALPGLGPKMAHLFLQCSEGKVEGIAVDVHVHRICQRFLWAPKTKGGKVDSAATTAEDTRRHLEAWVPRQHWDSINSVLVGLGQTICTARNPKCGDCAANEMCPNAFIESREKKSGDKKRQRSGSEKDVRDLEEICSKLKRR